MLHLCADAADMPRLPSLLIFMKSGFKSWLELVRKIYSLARPYGRGKLLAVCVAALAQGLFQAIGVTSIFPFLVLAANPSQIRESAIASKVLAFLPSVSDGGLLLLAGAFAVVMLALSNAVNIAAEFIRTRYAFGFCQWMQTLLMRTIISRPYSAFLQENTAVFMKKVTGDVGNYANNVLLTFLDSIARTATIVLLVLVLVLVNPLVAGLAGLLFGAFYIIVFKAFGAWRVRASEQLKELQRAVGVEGYKLLHGAKPVKVHGVEEHFLGNFSDYCRRLAKILSAVPLLASIPKNVIEPLFGFLLVAVVLFYANSGQGLADVLPSLGVMALAAYRLMPAFQLLYSQLTQLTTSRHALDEVFDEFVALEQAAGKEHTADDGSFSRPPALVWHRELRLEQLSFRYPKANKPVIENLSLVVPKRTSLGIVGETGCGKSTLVDMILGLHVPTSGRILVDDHPLGPKEMRAWRACIGYVPQDIFLIDDTVLANIAFGISPAEIDRSALLAAAEAAQIREFIEKELPHGFDTDVGERGVRLSGGQRQRIGLARALYHKPEVLILDEATSALDYETEAEVMKAISNLQGSVTMIIIAHRLSTVERCDQILRLETSK